jgi:hypothetical protein
MATLAFARNVRGGSAERVHRGARGPHRGRGLRGPDDVDRVTR